MELALQTTSSDEMRVWEAGPGVLFAFFIGTKNVLALWLDSLSRATCGARGVLANVCIASPNGPIVKQG